MDNSDQQDPRTLGSASEPSQGQVVAGRFELEQPVGSAQFGSLWLARDRQTQRPCAVRLGDGATLSHDEVAARFWLEADAAARIRCEHTLHILSHGDFDGTPFIAQELLIGESLEHRVKYTGALAAQSALQYVAEVAAALGMAHASGIVHGALSTERIFLARSSGKEVVKVLDFGALAANPTTTEAQRHSLTPATSPEQVSGAVPTQQSDVWALGEIAFFALTGRHIFTTTDQAELARLILSGAIPRPSELRSSLSEDVDQWAERALNRAVLRRWRGPMELVSGLATALSLPVPRVSAPFAPSSVPPPTGQARQARRQSSSTNAFAPYSPRHSPVPSRPAQLRLTSSGPRPVTPAPSDAQWPTSTAKHTMIGMGSSPPPSSSSPTLRGMPRTPPPISQIPPSAPTVRGMGAIGVASTPPNRPDSAYRASNGRAEPPSASHSVNNAPEADGRSGTGTGAMGGNRPSFDESLAAERAASRWIPSAEGSLNRTMLGVGARFRTGPQPANHRPGEYAIDQQSPGADLNRTVLGIGAQPPAPAAPHAAEMVLTKTPAEPFDRRRTVLGIGAEPPRMASPAARHQTVMGLAPRTRVPSAAPGATSTMASSNDRIQHRVVQNAASADTSRFFVPRQSTLLGVGDDVAAEVEAARAAAAFRIPSGRNDTVDPSLAQLRDGSNVRSETLRGSRFREESTAQRTAGGAPVTSLKPALASCPPPPPGAEGPGLSRAESAPAAGNEYSGSHPDPGTAFGYSPAEEGGASPEEKEHRISTLPTPPAPAPAERLSASPPAPSVSSVESSAQGSARRRRRILFMVVAAVILLMLTLLVAALLVQYSRRGRAPSREAAAAVPKLVGPCALRERGDATLALAALASRTTDISRRAPPTCAALESSGERGDATLALAALASRTTDMRRA